MPEDEPGELIDGHLVEEEMPDAMHETIVSWLNALLRAWVVPRAGFVLGSGAKFRVSTGRGRKPDLTVYLPGGRVPPRRGVIRVPPDIAIEVITPTPRDERRDRIEKVDDYAAFGVRYYWIVDSHARTLAISKYPFGFGAQTGEWGPDPIHSRGGSGARKRSRGGLHEAPRGAGRGAEPSRTSHDEHPSHLCLLT